MFVREGRNCSQESGSSVMGVWISTSLCKGLFDKQGNCSPTNRTASWPGYSAYAPWLCRQAFHSFTNKDQLSSTRKTAIHVVHLFIKDPLYVGLRIQVSLCALTVDLRRTSRYVTTASAGECLYRLSLRVLWNRVSS